MAQQAGTQVKDITTDNVAAPTDQQGAAFFDVDNTMMQGASIYWLARGLASRKYFTTADLVRFGWQQLRFRLLAKEHAGDMSAAKAAALAFVEGWRVEDMQRLSEEIFDELMADRIWAGTRTLAQQHIDAGQKVWLVTAAPVELAWLIAKKLNLTGALGTVSEVHNGAYTGRLVGDLLHGAAKAAAIRKLAAAELLDLSECTAYSDSANDLPMLESVGRAVAVNPDPGLLREARQRGWEVRDFRTGRKAVKAATPIAVAAGVTVAAACAVVALRRRR